MCSRRSVPPGACCSSRQKGSCSGRQADRLEQRVTENSQKNVAANTLDSVLFETANSDKLRINGMLTDGSSGLGGGHVGAVPKREHVLKSII